MTSIAVIGVGAVGARVARQVLSTEGSIDVVLRDERAARLDTVARSLGEGARIDTAPYGEPIDVDVAVLAGRPPERSSRRLRSGSRGHGRVASVRSGTLRSMLSTAGL